MAPWTVASATVRVKARLVGVRPVRSASLYGESTVCYRLCDGPVTESLQFKWVT